MEQARGGEWGTRAGEWALREGWVETWGAIWVVLEWLSWGAGVGTGTGMVQAEEVGTGAAGP